MLRAEEKEIYKSIYHTVEERMESCGRKMPCLEESFVFAAGMQPGQCDGKEMQSASNPCFMEMAYMGFLNRLPDADAHKIWKREMKNPPDVFRKMCIDTLIFSPEAVSKHAYFENNMLIETKRRRYRAIEDYIQNGNGKLGFKDKLAEKLYRIYIRFPYPIRNGLRRVLRRTTV